MSTTIFRMAGPLMAWPAASRYRYRMTEVAPMYSGLVGLVSAAVGVKRGEPVPSWVLAAPKAARLDRPGTVLKDFHTINPRDRRQYSWLSDEDWKKVNPQVHKGTGAANLSPVITERFYRQDAEVIIFFDDPDGLVARSLQAPVFTLYAGRKACPLTFPAVLGTCDASWETCLTDIPTTAETGPLQAVCYVEPETLPVLKRTTALETPAGPVAQSYVPHERAHVTVTPPVLPSWFDVMEVIQ